jgi:lysozyme
MLSRKLKKRIRRILFIVIGLTLLIIGSWMFFQWLTYRKAKFTRYTEFGINIPNGYEIHGIDVSKYQSVIAWEEVRKMKVHDIQMGFAFIKATQGAGSTDPQFRRNWKKAKEAGVPRGAYHFFIASADGAAQANHFIKEVELEDGDLPPVLDVELLNGVSPDRLKEEVHKWLVLAEAHYGIKPIIYTNVDFYIRNLGPAFDEYPLWAAHYYQPGQPRIGRSWTFWQHSDQGHVNGITHKVDFNVFNGDSAAFKKMLWRKMEIWK